MDKCEVEHSENCEQAVEQASVPEVGVVAAILVLVHGVSAVKVFDVVLIFACHFIGPVAAGSGMNCCKI